MKGNVCAVRFFSRGGNTKKLAERMAQAVGVRAQSIPAPVNEPVDVLFLGAAVYWGGVDGKVREFIRTLDKEKIGRVVVFSNSSLAERAYPSMKRLLEGVGLKVEEDNFYCRGEFHGLYSGHPNQEDLKHAEDFARKFL